MQDVLEPWKERRQRRETYTLSKCRRRASRTECWTGSWTWSGKGSNSLAVSWLSSCLSQSQKFIYTCASIVSCPEGSAFRVTIWSSHTVWVSLAVFAASQFQFARREGLAGRVAADAAHRIVYGALGGVLHLNSHMAVTARGIVPMFGARWCVRRRLASGRRQDLRYSCSVDTGQTSPGSADVTA